MTLPASGIITLGDIAAEFGGTVPHGLSEYYGSGGAPASGVLKASDFYGLSNIITNAFTFNKTDLSQFDWLATDAGGAGPRTFFNNGNLETYVGAIGGKYSEYCGGAALVAVTPGQLYRLEYTFYMSNPDRFNGKRVGVTDRADFLTDPQFGISSTPDYTLWITGNVALQTTGTYTYDFTAPASGEVIIHYAIDHDVNSAGTSQLQQFKVYSI